MNNNIDKKKTFSLQFRYMSVLLFIVTSTSVIFTYLLVDYRTKDITDIADSRLLTAVEMNREIIGIDYHNGITGDKSVSKNSFLRIVERNDDLCRRLNLQYLWSVLDTGKDLVFTSATHSDLNNPESHCASFFEVHKNPESFASALSSVGTPVFSSFHNEWGEGRQVLISRKDTYGRTYIFGASVKLEKLEEMEHKTIFHSIVIGLCIMICSFFLAFLLTKELSASVKVLIESAVQMANGNLDLPIPSSGINELSSLSESLEKLRNGLRSYISELLESEQRYRLLHESAGVGIGYYTPDGKVISFNTMALKNMNGKAEDFEGKSIFEIFPKDEAEFYFERIKQAAISESPQEYEDQVSLPSGTSWFHSTIARITDPAGEVIGIQIISTDISRLKNTEVYNKKLLDEKELLLKEVHHRIKNNMNTIKGLITLQLSSEENSAAIASLCDAESRIQSMITLYDKLYCTDNYRELSIRQYLQPLADEIVACFPHRPKVEIKTEIDDFILNVQSLAPLGIIVNELLTNTMKYAFVERSDGVISLKASKRENVVTIIYTDNGIGLPESVTFENSAGFGMKLAYMLSEQIGGSIQIERGEGTKFVLEFEV